MILIGQSWGGMYATAFINRFPGRVAGAVLIESGPLTGATAERLKADIFDIDLRREWLNDMAWNSQFLTGHDHARLDYQMTIGAKVSQPRFHERVSPDPEPSWRLGAAANRYVEQDGQDGHGVFTYDFTTALGAFRRPVLFIAGGASEVLGPSLQQEQVRYYPDARLVTVPGAGHDAHWTHTAEVLAAVRGYLTTIEGGNP